MNLKIKILKDKLGNITVSFPYTPQFVQKIKTIKGYRCQSENQNHFGTFPEVKIKQVLPMNANTKYEERCIGFYPGNSLLEAIINVKLPYGYNGNL